MPEPTQSCKKGYFSPPRKMDFNCTYNLVGDRTAFIWENHVICVIHLTESAPSTTLHLSNNSSSAFFFFFNFLFSVPQHSIFTPFLLSQLSALPNGTNNRGTQAQSSSKIKKNNAVHESTKKCYLILWLIFFWITIYIPVHLNFN